MRCFKRRGGIAVGTRAGGGDASEDVNMCVCVCLRVERSFTQSLIVWTEINPDKTAVKHTRFHHRIHMHKYVCVYICAADEIAPCLPLPKANVINPFRNYFFFFIFIRKTHLSYIGFVGVFGFFFSLFSVCVERRYYRYPTTTTTIRTQFNPGCQKGFVLSTI